jgi:hypothetical protein
MLGGRKGRMRMDELGDAILGNLKDQHRGDRRSHRGPDPAVEAVRLVPRGRQQLEGRRAVRAAPDAKEEGVRCRIEPISPNGADKATRAQAAQAMAAMGRIHIPEGSEGDEVIQELIGFPTSAHDEEVDLLAVMCRAIDMAHPAIVPPEEKPPEPIRGINEMSWDEMIAAQQPQRDRV